MAGLAKVSLLQAGWVFLFLLLTGCSGNSFQLLESTSAITESTSEAIARSSITRSETVPRSTPAATTDPGARVPKVVPTVDVSQHNVPLDQVYFDTFRPANRAVPLSQASPELIRSLQDAIPPIHDPRYVVAGEAPWLGNQDIVIGYAIDGQAWAYPVRVLNYHEIVNDTLDGQPLLISYCPLCYTGIVFSRQVGDEVLSFGNTSALYESDLVMVDYETGSYWWQVIGEAIVGPLTGKRLTVLPSVTTTWREWRALYPNSLVLSQDTGYSRNYEHDPFANYSQLLNSGRFAFPVSQAGRDQRLEPAAQVLAVKVGDETRAYPLAWPISAAISDRVGGQRLVVFVKPDGPSGAAYRPVVGERSLTFQVQDERIIDLETESTWNLAGRAIDGPLKGAQLPAIPSRTAFWFAVVAAEPGITVFQPETD